MSKRRAVSIIVPLLIIAAIHSPAADFADGVLHLHVMTLRQAESPQIVGDYVLFSFESPIPVRHIAAAFAHEDFQVLHHYERNVHGVYVLALVPQAGIELLTYRIVVDGLWMPDPNNPSQSRAPEGTLLSSVDTAGAFPVPRTSPITKADGRIEFYYYGTTGQTVYVTGDFNYWDPFMYRLHEESPGEYMLSLPVEPGLHAYRYVVDGKPLLDPLNPSVGLDTEGNRASRVIAYRD